MDYTIHIKEIGGTIMKPSILWTLFTILIVICILAAHHFLGVSRRQEHRKAILLKGITGLCFVAAGALTASVCPDRHFALPVMAGLILGLAGDELLALRFPYPAKHDLCFTAGGAAFAIGHVMYLLALFHCQFPLLRASIPVGLAGFLLSLLYLKRRNMQAGTMQIPLTIYMLLLSVTLGVSWGAAAGQPSPQLLLFAAGALLFLTSDNILFAFCFGDRHTAGMNRAIHGTYYAAQLCFALSMGVM